MSTRTPFKPRDGSSGYEAALDRSQHRYNQVYALEAEDFYNRYSARRQSAISQSILNEEERDFLSDYCERSRDQTHFGDGTFIYSSGKAERKANLNSLLQYRSDRYRRGSVLSNRFTVPGKNRNIVTTPTTYTDAQGHIKEDVHKVFRVQWGTGSIPGYFRSYRGSTGGVFESRNLMGSANIQVESHDLTHVKPFDLSLADPFDPKDGTLALTLISLHDYLRDLRDGEEAGWVETALKDACEYSCYQSKSGVLSIYPSSRVPPVIIDMIPAALTREDRTTIARRRLDTCARLTIHPLELHDGPKS
ncbi:hypothetical protein I302_106853 [Kwoniella bestiolae CBS 10118]|uniref:Uncharacterized protein n=1 Tax=Kwoniella bestiolae CBS 10118 TaxID=1296100 RepID=A0A1B9G086_9TREE|nr:hypothetical protein I302_05882 [Kwoniella bestiolae CBS 10118]OCF24422.1 hypothetical protein I302_05882 [Kwoniella bestiolae CBS 10118]